MVRRISGIAYLVVLTGFALGCASGGSTHQTGVDRVTDLFQLPKNSRGYRKITAGERRPLLEGKDFLLVTVNDSAMEVIPSTDFTAAVDEIAEHLDRFPRKDQPTVLYCQAGPLSRSAAQDLLGLGCNNVIWLDRGINAWKRAGFEVEQRRDRRLRTNHHAHSRKSYYERQISGAHAYFCTDDRGGVNCLGHTPSCG